jgi:tetratricopeptide (TPR) repeat protein
MRPPVLLLCLLLTSPLLADEAARKEALAHNTAAIERYSQGDYERALSRFRQAYNLDSKDPTIRRNLAYCLIRLGDALLLRGDPGRALRDYGEAEALLPKAWPPRFRNGLALYRARREREAVTLLERALRDHPRQVDGWELLALASYRIGHNPRAIQAWTQALKLEPKSQRLARDLARARKEERVEGQLFLDQSTPHFAIKYDGARDAALGRRIGQLLEEAYRVVGGLLGRHPPHEIAVVVYPKRTFRTLTGSHAWVAALYDGKIRMPAAGLAKVSLPEQRRVLRHEYAHALIHSIGGSRVPPWLHEGLAQLAEGRTRASALKVLAGQRAPTLAALSKPFAKVKEAKLARLLYAAACDWAYFLSRRGGSAGLGTLLEQLGKGKSLGAACKTVFGATPADLHAAWAKSLGH